MTFRRAPEAVSERCFRSRSCQLRPRFFVDGQAGSLPHGLLKPLLCVLAVLCVSVVDTPSACAQPTNWLVRAASAAREQLDTNRPRIVRRSIELEDASLETLQSRLGWFGIEIPLEIKGDVTASLGAEVDLSHLNDARSYRINGSLSSKQMIVEGLTLQNVSATARYVDGRLTLRQLAATVPDPRRGEPAGGIDGEAAMQLIPVGTLTVSIRLEGVPLEQFRSRIEALAFLSGGRLTGRLTTEAPVATIRDVTTWRGHGHVALADLVASGRDVSRVETSLLVESAKLTLTDIVAFVEGERLAGRGSLGLAAPFRFESSIQVPKGDLSRVASLLQQTLPGTWSGAYTASARATGAVRPFQLDATAAITGEGWLIADVPVDRFAANAASNGKTLELTQFDARAAGGDVTGSATASLESPFKHESSLALEGLRLSHVEKLARTIDPRLDLDGIASGTFTSSGTLTPRAITAQGDLTINDLQLNRQTFSAATLKGTLSPNTLELTALELVAARSRLTGNGRIELAGNRGFSLHFAPQRFDLAALEPVILVVLRDDAASQHTVAYRGAQEDNGRPTPTAPELAGTATGDIDATGDLLPFKLDALDGSLSFDDLTVGGVTFDRAEIEATTNDDTIALSRVSLTKGEGHLEGRGSFELGAPGAFTVNMRATGFTIDEASPLFGQQSGLPAKLPPISGALDGQIAFAGEMQPFRLTDAQGTLTGDDIHIGRLLVNRFAVNVATADDVLHVNDFVLVIDDGRLTGNASIELQGQKSFEATLRPDDFRIELLRPLFGEGGFVESNFPPIAGRLTGNISLKGRLAPAALEAVSGSLRSEMGRVSGIPFQRAAIVVAGEDGVARVREMSAVSDFGSFRGNGTVGLSMPYPYTADLSFRDFDLSAIGNVTAAITEEQRSDIDSPAEVAPGPGVLPVELEGLANIVGSIQGTIAPFVLAGEGRADADHLDLNANDLSAVFRRTTLTAPSFSWRYNERRLTLADITAGLGEGMLTGTAAVPLGDAAGGALSLRVSDVSIADLIELPVQFGGNASAELDATLSPVGIDGERNATGNAQFLIPALRVGRVDAGNVEARVSFKDDVFSFDVQGRLFDGPIVANGTASLESAEHNRSAGHFQWTAADLARMSTIAGGDPSLAGRVDARIDYDLSSVTKATGRIQVSEVRRGTTLLTDRFDARILWTDSELRVENAAGGYAGGTISLIADLNPFDNTRGTVEVLLRRADAQRAVGWIPGLEPVEGTLDMRLRGRLANLWRWQGDAEIGRGRYGPLAFSSARVPLTIDVNPFQGALHVESHRANLRAAHGRGIMNVSADLGLISRLDIDSTFTNLDAAEVLDGDGLGGRLAGGRISGTMQLSSRNFRTISDLEGSLAATLTGSRAQNLPVIGSVFDVVRLPTGGGGTVERGEIRVFIRRGVARIDKLAIAGTSFRVFAEGTVALASQRLALDVVADTSPGRSDRLIAAFLLRQFVDYATPIGWLQQANRFISERAIYLRVTGTVARPVVRVRPFEQLGQEGVRFFLNEIAAPLGQGSPTPR